MLHEQVKIENLSWEQKYLKDFIPFIFQLTHNVFCHETQSLLRAVMPLLVQENAYPSAYGYSSKVFAKGKKILSFFPDEFDSDLMMLIDLRCFFSCASSAPHLTSGLQKLIK